LAASQAQSQGRAASDQAILAMAAQGQDVSSAGVQRIAGSYEAISEQNAMQLEINAMREALGFELEVVNYNFQKNSAKINRDMTILSSALNFGAKAYGLGGL
jgi:negative regulator of replication initiation